MAEFDAIIVGSGPAGVSAAFPLLAAGLRVLMVDGGRAAAVLPPASSYLHSRGEDADQWEWLIGKNHYALTRAGAASPKLRAPTHAHVFEGFAAANRIVASDFDAAGSLAQGGLANAWGCGVARLTAEELSSYPFPAQELDASHAAIARRIGISGAQADDLTDYFGLDEWAQPPVAMDSLQAGILARYQRNGGATRTQDFRIGRARLALLTEGRDERQACDLSGTCLWGCRRGALYTPLHDLAALKRHPGFIHRPGFIVQAIGGTAQERTISGTDATGTHTVSARALILAAGTLATTRLALQALHLQRPVSMQACPTAAFLLWAPGRLGLRRERAVALGQLAFTLAAAPGVTAFGSLFSTTGIPLAEFARHLPMRKRYAIDVLGSLLSSCCVGNLFLPGHLTAATLALNPAGQLSVQGAYRPEVAALMATTAARLRRHFLRLGAVLVPGSFSLAPPGSDIHHAASLPMRHTPGPGETGADGALFGLEDVYIADAASLPTLSEKSHTFTLMANADRIARRLAARWKPAAT